MMALQKNLKRREQNSQSSKHTEAYAQWVDRLELRSKAHLIAMRPRKDGHPEFSDLGHPPSSHKKLLSQYENELAAGDLTKRVF
jgi:hypothetical protein